MGQSSGKAVLVTDEVQLEHFKLLRVVGKGAFGKVRIVERKDTGLTFALKYIRKDEVVRSENVRNIVRERRMLEHLNHPFLCNLRYSFQDYDYLYLVVDLMSGGDLRFHISRKAFKEEAVRFWIAELGCALRYIHKQGVVHRDVKPDNVLLDSEGHVHLADFNVASELSTKKMLSSKSGTLAYLAPEVYEGKGYRSEVDWWSLGVLFYECIYNKRPFESSRYAELAASIVQATPKYPVTKPLVSTACVSAIQALICKNLDDRIGANGFSNFTNHPFFVLNNTIDFQALEKKQLKPIFTPSSEKTNFDATYDLEELLLEEAPLEARARHSKPRAQPKPNASAKEKREASLYQMIEQLFEPFDYTHATFEKFADITEESPITTLDETSVADTSHLTLDGEVPFRTNTPSGFLKDDRRGKDSPTDTGSPPLSTQISLPAMSPLVPKMELPELQEPLDLTSSSKDLSRLQKPQYKRTKSVGGKAAVSPASRGSKGDLRASLSAESRANPDQLKPPGTKKAGILGILSSKKDKDKSSKQYENGVLGKDGARMIIRDS